MQVTEAVASLRELADYLEVHADKFGSTDIYGGVTVFPWRDGPALVAALPGRWEKTYSDAAITVKQTIGGVRLDVMLLRSDVCEKVTTGRKITKQVPTAFTTVEEDEYEWDCKPILQTAAEGAA